MNEYTSGVVRPYNVIEKSGSAPCRIRIEVEALLKLINDAVD